MKINPKSQKGAITLIVLVTMLFLIAFLISMYIRISNKAQTSAETTQEIAKKYNNIEDAQVIYDSYFATEDVIPIYTVEQLKKLGSGEQIEIEQEGKIYTFAEDGYYILKNDINLNEGNYTIDKTDGSITFTENAEEWIPLNQGLWVGDAGSFCGTLDGLGHEIKGLYINDTDSTTGNYKGLFYAINSNVIIKNLGLSESYIQGRENVGGFVGNNKGTIENCYNNSIIVASYKSVGGIVGHNTANINKCHNQGKTTLLTGATTYGEAGGIAGQNVGNIYESYNEGVVTNENSYDTGGIVGTNGKNGMINYCYNKGDIVAYKNYVGGISGINQGTITNSYNISNCSMTSGNYLGGITGSNYGTISGAYNLGKMEGTRNTGGITASNSGTVSLCKNSGEISGTNIGTGGITAYNSETGIVEKSFNEGYILGENMQVGGISSENLGTIKQCFNKGTVYSRVYRIGGIVGDNHSNVINCYNTGNIEGESGDNLGGIVGYNIYTDETPTVTNCYNTGLISGSTTTSGIATVGAIIGSNGSTSTVSNCYSLENMHTNFIGTDSGTTTNSIFKTAIEMKALDGSFIALLNQGLNPTVWVENSNVELNGGYPILSWQVE